jgi:hypothetical protein
VLVVLVRPNAVILPELGEDLGRFAQRKLALGTHLIFTSNLNGLLIRNSIAKNSPT